MTKAERTAQVRAWSRLLAQSKLNAGDAERLGRWREAAAWASCVLVLTDVLAQLREGRVVTVQSVLL